MQKNKNQINSNQFWNFRISKLIREIKQTGLFCRTEGLREYQILSYYETSMTKIGICVYFFPFWQYWNVYIFLRIYKYRYFTSKMIFPQDLPHMTSKWIPHQHHVRDIVDNINFPCGNNSSLQILRVPPQCHSENAG